MIFSSLHWHWPLSLMRMPYTGVFQLVARWAEGGSLQRAFMASVKQRDSTKKLDLSLLHGDGSNTVAKKGGTRSATAGTSTRRGRK